MRRIVFVLIGLFALFTLIRAYSDWRIGNKQELSSELRSIREIPVQREDT
jgi:hypothetical protein